MEQNILQVKDLRVSYYTYAGEVQSVRGVSFHVKKGETLAIVGESGCGKSVTAKSIMRLIADPGKIKDGSSIVFDGRDVLAMRKRELRSYRGDDCAMIFQDALTSLDPTMKVGKQIAEVLKIHGKANGKRAAAQAVELLRQVGIPNPERRAQEYPHQFSGGMRQRAMIATALACSPKLLIADEPTTALDVTIQAQIMALLRNLQKESGMSMILITHDIGLVASMADRVIVMYAGQMIEEAPVKELFAAPAHPYTKALLQTVPGIYDEKDRELVAIPGMVPENYDSIPGCRFADRCAFRTKGCDQPQSYRQIGEGHFVRCMLAKEGET